ncbi:MAG: hypothetical protein CXR30_09895 [Geobacter sp.]|nr:MAG: hypothetical protein CXR30_09895 [Geobacter sp.]
MKGTMQPSRSFEFPETEVRALREQFGLSQAKFADLVGISVGTLRNWEQGRRKPEGPARVLLQVASRHPGHFWTLEGNSPKEQAAQLVQPDVQKTACNLNLASASHFSTKQCKYRGSVSNPTRPTKEAAHVASSEP